MTSGRQPARQPAPTGRSAGGVRPYRWRIRGASVQGYSHVREGKWCEDSFAHLSLYERGSLPDVHVLAVADGAGSAPRSAEGSRLAVAMATRLVRDRIHPSGRPATAPDLRQLLTAAHEEIVTEFRRVVTAVAGREHIGEFATTLTVVVLAYPLIGYLSIGDGFIVVRTGEGGQTNLHLLDAGSADPEHASQTVFLTSDTSRAARVNAVYDPWITGVFMSTDGLIPVTLRRDPEGRLAVATEPVIDTVLGLLDDDHFDASGLVQLLLREAVTEVTQDDTTLLVAVLCR
ncbi:PP2C family serine/threonine-protein phosphatase [Frankia sp. Cj3]|uniref:PP2C family serine/threonine-protein phosphatase n=1 Tax=Frankia sp. Cj3 TaxID=2880976 RepID=UPI001EF51A43|nr:PP2C family serine/threonine-protein phosphatase [Frankia sp. Cj3]